MNTSMDHYLLNWANKKSTQNRTSLSSQIHLSSEQILQRFRLACENRELKIIEEMCLSHVVRPHFDFMKSLFQSFVEKEQYHLLTLPYFDGSQDFRSIVADLTGSEFNKGVLKKFGLMIEEYGVPFLNNIYCLKEIYGHHLNINEVLKLDHSRQLSLYQARLIKKMDTIIEKYPLSRIWKVFSNVSNDVLEDLYRIVNRSTNPEGLIKSSLPKKPNSIIQVHDELSMAVMKEEKVNLILNQDISFLDGMNLLDFTIEVPSDSNGLLTTSRELKHCVHIYDKRVVEKESQILNLKKSGKLVYTIELRPQDEDYQIIQFKGYQNEKSYEGDKGIPYREKLIKLLERK